MCSGGHKLLCLGLQNGKSSFTETGMLQRPSLGVKSKGLSQMGRGALGTSYCAHHVKFWGFEAQRKGLACREKLRDLRRIYGS